MSAQQMCEGRVWASFTWVACNHKAKVERDGKHYCGRHDPVAVKAKKDAKSAEFDRKWNDRQANIAADDAAKAEQKRRADCYPELLEALQLIASTAPVDAALDPQRAVRVARAAIAKATGEQA